MNMLAWRCQDVSPSAVCETYLDDWEDSAFILHFTFPQGLQKVAYILCRYSLLPPCTHVHRFVYSDALYES
jgi:hypothetical protein